MYEPFKGTLESEATKIRLLQRETNREAIIEPPEEWRVSGRTVRNLVDLCSLLRDSTATGGQGRGQSGARAARGKTGKTEKTFQKSGYSYPGIRGVPYRLPVPVPVIRLSTLLR